MARPMITTTGEAIHHEVIRPAATERDLQAVVLLHQMSITIEVIGEVHQESMVHRP